MSATVMLPYKAGIKKDNTPFDSEHCIDGSWMRFYNGRPETIGGMKQLARNLSSSFYSDILVVPTSVNKAFVYLSYSTGISKLEFNLNPFSFSSVISTNIAPAFSARDALRWQGITLTRPLDQKTYVAFLGINDLNDINDNSAPLFFYGLNEAGPADKLTDLSNNIDPAMNGGMCFAEPYLFLYGSGGKVRHSKNNDPFDFSVNESDPASGGVYKIGGGDKVVAAYPIRGGVSSSPTLLLWTLSSVIRMSNAGDNKVNFSVDVIAKDTSILSSRCVVEHNGFFFWSGTDGFYVYNGLVRPLDNLFNRKFFFSNLDLKNRQKVFAVKNPSFSEVWWVWPNAADANNWALIFNYENKENKTWYDTPFAQRSAGTYYGAENLMLTIGLPLTGDFTDNDLALWLHEQNVGQTWTKSGENNARIDALSCSLSFPYFSLSLFDKNSTSRISDRFVSLLRFFPDFLYKSRPTSSSADISLEVSTIKYPQSSPSFSSSYVFNKSDEKLDIREQGRYMSLKISSDEFFQAGSLSLELAPGDGQ